jgi:multidrug efflux pump subunit AcrA (membrane-fusion protein)
MHSFLRKLYPILILAGAVAGFLILRATGPSAPPPVQSERAWPVAGITVQLQRLEPSVELYARSRSLQTMTLRSALEADVVEVPVRPGTQVPAGSLLLRLDTSELDIQAQRLRADLDEAEAALEAERLRQRSDQQSLERERTLLGIAERSLQRSEDLRARNLGSESDVDVARRNFEQALLAVDARQQALAQAPLRRAQQQARIDRIGAELQRLELDRSRTAIRAAEAQRIVEVHVSVGERARVGEPLLRSFPLEALELRAPLPEHLVPQVEQLLSRGIALEASARVSETDIRAIARRLDAETRPGEAGVGLWLEIVEGAERLPLNRFVPLRLHFPAQDDVIAIPFEAIYGRDRIFRIIDGRLAALTIDRVGEAQLANGRSRALIRHPALMEGDVIIGTRLPNAVEGLRVQVESFVHE